VFKQLPCLDFRFESIFRSKAATATTSDSRVDSTLAPGVVKAAKQGQGQGQGQGQSSQSQVIRNILMKKQIQVDKNDEHKQGEIIGK